MKERKKEKDENGKRKQFRNTNNIERQSGIYL